MKVVVLAGGISTERDVSLVTGTKIYEALKKKGHKVILLDLFMGYDGDIDGIFDMEKNWADSTIKVNEINCDIEAVKAMRKDKSNVLFGKNVIEICRLADIVFLGLHGDVGENGKLQAAFDLYDIKYTGTDYMSSALAMDKQISKQLFIQNGISTPESRMINGENDDYLPDFPCVVKVCNGGSSVGVYVVGSEEYYRESIKNAFHYENTVMVEKYIKGREFTCCVMEGEALPIVEIAPKNGFYDYKNKYQEGSTIETCPADISKELTDKIQDMAKRVYEVLRIKTYARMDILADEEENIYCLEANTLPGMTPTSLIPQEAAAIGIEFPELCEKIIEMSLRKYE